MKISNLVASVKAFLKIGRRLPIFIGVVGLFAVWFLFFRGGNSVEETLVVSRGEFLQQVSVSGTVVAGSDVKLGFAQGGRIAHVYVKVADMVTEGSVLAEVENGDIRAQVLQKEANVENAEAKLAALQAGTRPEEIAVAEAEVLQDEATLQDAINNAYSVADDAVRNKTDQMYSNPRSNPQLNFSSSNYQYKTNAEAGRKNMEAVLLSWQQNLVENTDDLLVQAGVAQQNLTSATSYLGSANAALNTAVPNQSFSQSTIDGYIADVATARSNINTAISTLSAAVSALNSAKKNLLLKQAGTTEEDLAAQEASVKAAVADLENTRALLRKTLIIAPFTGVVTKVDAKVGQTVAANVDMVSMISSGTFQIESFIPEINVALVNVGDPASTTLDAYGPDTFFGTKVISIDPASEVRNGVSTYRAKLEFNNNDPRIKAGMTANVVITTDRRNGVISIPQEVVIDRAGKHYVIVKEDGGNVEREVSLGEISALGNIEITSGLKSGEVVVLSKTQ